VHELSVTESILDITLRHAKQAGAERVTNLYLVIGQLATIIDDSVQFYWDIVSKDTPAEGARLHFRRIPVELLCLECNQAFRPGKSEFACPYCNSERIKILSGEEFYLEAIDIDNNHMRQRIPVVEKLSANDRIAAQNRPCLTRQASFH
jgi:hydrogenase nickel incorporation protein HypA/HybF